MAGMLDWLLGNGDGSGAPDGAQPAGGMLNDPRLFAALGAMHGMAPYLGYSRLPQTSAQTLGGAAGGIMEGIGAGNANQLQQTQLQLLRLGLPKAQYLSDVFGASGNAEQQPAGIVDRETPPALPPQQAQGGQPPVAPGMPPQPGQPPAPMPQPPPNLSMAPGGAAMPGLIPPPGQPPQAQPVAMPGMPQGGPPQAAPAPASGPAPPPLRMSRWGLPLLPGMNEQQALIASQVDPEGYKARLAAYYAPIRGGSTYRDVNTGQMQMAPQGIPGVPGVPGDSNYNQNAAALESARKWAEVAPANAQTAFTQAAMRQREEALQRQKFGLEYGVAAPGAGDITGAPRPTGVALGGNKVPPKTVPQSQTTPQVAAITGTNILTDRGTIVPTSQGNQVLGPGGDLIGKQNTESIATEKNWNQVRPSIETSRQRLMASAEAFGQVEGSGYNEHKAEIANNLRGMGMPKVADLIMGGAETDAVKSAIWNSMQEALSSLKAINAGTGGRILNSEFNAFMEHGFSPDMPAKTLHRAISAQLGTTFQVGNMIDDYFGVGRQTGWRDANQFQSSYLRANPIEGFVKYSSEAIGPFKGMEGGGPAYTEGQTATHADGSKAVFRGGKWVVLPRTLPPPGTSQAVPLQ